MQRKPRRNIDRVVCTESDTSKYHDEITGRGSNNLLSRERQGDQLPMVRLRGGELEVVYQDAVLRNGETLSQLLRK